MRFVLLFCSLKEVFLQILIGKHSIYSLLCYKKFKKNKKKNKKKTTKHLKSCQSIASDKSNLLGRVYFLLKSGFPVKGFFILLKVEYLVAIVNFVYK